MLPYIIALVTLLAYWWIHEMGDKDSEGLWDWLKQNPKTAIVQVAVMFLVVYFRAVLTPYLAIPVVVAITSALLTGTFIDKLAKFWAWLKKLLGMAPDEAETPTPDGHSQR